MPLDELKIGGLYVLLFVRSSPPQIDNFHWGLYLHEDTDNGGTKYHITGQSSGWITDHGQTYGILKSFLLIGLFLIADVPAGLEGYVDQTIRTYDDQINTPGMTCRVWVFWVLGLLKQEVNGHRVLMCDDIAALEREIKDWGNGNAPGAAMNEQPRPVAVSQICDISEAPRLCQDA